MMRSKFSRFLILSGCGVAASLLPAAHAVAAPADASPSEIAFSGLTPDFKSIDVGTRNVYDYTFSTAPVDWKIQAGVWEMTNRWSCSPGWSWFGGRSNEVAAIWNKRRLAGDVSAQMYFAFKMGMAGAQDSRWMEYPNNAAMTICGDGSSLGTGYTFIAGANENTRSILMRNGQIVAQSQQPEAILPRLTDGNPGTNDVHRRWWYLKVEKIGAKVNCFLDDKLIVSYTDPKPIEGGQTAIWTVDNGIMLARVQLYFQKEMAPNFTPSLKTVPFEHPIKPAKPKTKIASLPTELTASKRLR